MIPPPAMDDAAPAKARVLLVDDHPIVRQGLVQLINQEPNLSVCGEAEDVRQALQAVDALRPEIVILDLFLRESDGFDFLKSLRDRPSGPPVLVLSMHKESLHAERALRAGARGYIMKQAATERVVLAVHKVLTGELYVSERMASRLLSKLVDARGAGGERNEPSLEALSDREFEVFSLIGQGVGPTEMARRLGLSVKTIETYRENLKQKLNVKIGAALTRMAVEYAIRGVAGRST